MTSGDLDRRAVSRNRDFEPLGVLEAEDQDRRSPSMALRVAGESTRIRPA